MEHNDHYPHVDAFFKKAAFSLPTPSRERFGHVLERLRTPSPLPSPFRYWTLPYVVTPVLLIVFVLGLVQVRSLFASPDNAIAMFSHLEGQLSQFDDDGPYANQDIALLQ